MRNLLISALVIIGLSACGGASNVGGSSTPPPPPVPTGSISGATFDGLISNGTVIVYDFTTGAKGAQLGQTTSDSTGLYTLPIQVVSRPLLLEITGGTYSEEASGIQVTLKAAQKLTALVNYTTGTPMQVAVTTFTHLAAGLAAYEIKNGKAVAAAITDSNQRISALTGFDVATTLPKQIINLSNANAALTPELKAGFLAGAISSWTSKNMPNAGVLHLAPFTSIDFAQLLFQDISVDGLLDGMGLDSSSKPMQLSFGVIPLSVDTYRYGLGMAILDIAGNANNKTGLTPINVLSFAQNFANNKDAIFNNIPVRLVALPAPPKVIPAGLVSGTTFDGLINNGTVSIYDYTAGVKGNLISTTTSNNLGFYSVTLQVDSRPLLIEITGGSYTEEADNKTVSLKSIQKLSAVTNYTAGTPLQVAVTSFTHLAAGLAAYEISNGAAVATAINDANTRVSSLAGVNIVTTIPLQITDPTNINLALTPELKYGFLAGAISQWTYNNAPIDTSKNPPAPIPHVVNYDSIDFAQLMYQDIAADGKLDGFGLDSSNHPLQLGFGLVPLSVKQYRFGLGLSLLQMASNPNNKTGITSSQIYSYASAYAANTDPMFAGVAVIPVASPTITLLSPLTNAWVGSNVVTVSATIQDYAGLNLVELMVDGVSVASQTASLTNPNFTVNTTNYTTGAHTIGIRATNIVGLQTTTTVPVNVDNVPPSVSSIVFNNGCSITGTLVDLSSGLQPTVHMFYKDDYYGTIYVDLIIALANGTFSWTNLNLPHSLSTSWSQGTFSITSIDNAGNTTVINKHLMINQTNTAVTGKGYGCTWS